jgi:signal transduction histidine kinase
MATNIYSSYKIAESAVSINLAGRQRMLSQRTTKVLLQIQDDVNNSLPTQKDLQELGLVVFLFDTTLEGFRDGKVVTGGDNKPIHLAKVETPESERFVQETYALWNPYLKLLQPLRSDITRNGEGPQVSPDQFVARETRTFSNDQLTEVVTYARENNLKILAAMNNLTSDLEVVADKRAFQLRIIQIVGLTIALINVLFTLIKSIRDLMRGDRNLMIARKETTDILTTVREGLFLIDPKFNIGDQYSHSLPYILRRNVVAGDSFLEVLQEMVSKEVFDNARDYMELLFGDRVKENLVGELNPLSRVQVQGTGGKSHYLSFNFNRVVSGDDVNHLLVTVQDVTEIVTLGAELEAVKNQARREIEVLLELLSKDSRSLEQFLANTEQALSQINERMRANEDSGHGRTNLIGFIMRVVHGIKGEAAALNIDTFESYAHDFEQELSLMRERGEVRGEDMVRVTVLLEGFYERLTAISTVVKRLIKPTGTAAPVVEEEAASVVFEKHIKPLALRIAQDAKKDVNVKFDVAAINTLPRRIINELQSIAIQLVRNAVKHGIESPEERATLAKSPRGEIAITCQDLGQSKFAFFVRDNGRGISVDKIRRTLVESGQMSAQEVAKLSAKEVVTQIFKEGFSTAREADRDAGRGAGLGVVSEKVTLLHGHLTLSSKANEFAEFRVVFEV